MPLPEEEQRVVAKREERTLENGEHRQLVVGPLDGRGRGAHREHFLSSVVRATTDQDVGDPPCFQRLDVSAGEVAAVVAHALEEQAHVPRLHGHGLLAVALAHLPAARRQQPVDERRHRVGIRFLDAEIRDLLALAVDPRRRQRDDRRLTVDAAPERMKRDVAGLRAALHDRSERRVHGLLYDGARPEAGGEMEQLGPRRQQQLLHVLVERDVRAAEAVDRLLGIADDEELAGSRLRAPPIGLR
jgi:hypothetical protein